MVIVKKRLQKHLETDASIGCSGHTIPSRLIIRVELARRHFEKCKDATVRNYLKQPQVKTNLVSYILLSRTPSLLSLVGTIFESEYKKWPAGRKDRKLPAYRKEYRTFKYILAVLIYLHC